jgi:hypothetical protein
MAYLSCELLTLFVETIGCITHQCNEKSVEDGKDGCNFNRAMKSAALQLCHCEWPKLLRTGLKCKTVAKYSWFTSFAYEFLHIPVDVARHLTIKRVAVEFSTCHPKIFHDCLSGLH